MDILLFQGDHGRDSRGFPQVLRGAREKAQQAMIRLTVQKGKFRLDPELGSLFYKLGEAAEISRQDLALEYAKEALLGLEGVEVKRVTCKSGTGDWGTVSLEIWLECGGEPFRARLEL